MFEVTANAILSQPGDLRILEWGCGGTTVKIPRMLYDAGRTFTWFGIDSCDHWVSQIAAEVMGLPVVFKIFPYKGGCDQAAMQGHPMDAYVGAAFLLGHYDAVLIDGRKRAQCVAVARLCLKPGGIIILHEAERPRYHDACKGLVIKKHVGGPPHKEDGTMRDREVWVMRLP
jgi:hypothetical protein